MANPGFSAPDLTPSQIEKARSGKPPWPKNRDINFNVEYDPEKEEKR